MARTPPILRQWQNTILKYDKLIFFIIFYFREKNREEKGEKERNALRGVYAIIEIKASRFARRRARINDTLIRISSAHDDAYDEVAV